MSVRQVVPVYIHGERIAKDVTGNVSVDMSIEVDFARAVRRQDGSFEVPFTAVMYTNPRVVVASVRGFAVVDSIGNDEERRKIADTVAQYAFLVLFNLARDLGMPPPIPVERIVSRTETRR